MLKQRMNSNRAEKLSNLVKHHNSDLKTKSKKTFDQIKYLMVILKKILT